MHLDGQTTKHASGGVLLVGAAMCLVAAGCSDITPAPDEEGGGIIDSPTHEADALRDEDAREGEGEEEGRRR